MLGCVIDTCTIRCTPASRAAPKSSRELATAAAWSTRPRGKRTQ
jgi:hypothetical protein